MLRYFRTTPDSTADCAPTCLHGSFLRIRGKDNAVAGIHPQSSGQSGSGRAARCCPGNTRFHRTRSVQLAAAVGSGYGMERITVKAVTPCLDTSISVEYPPSTNRGTPQVQAWACGTRYRRIWGCREFPICSTNYPNRLNLRQLGFFVFSPLVQIQNQVQNRYKRGVERFRIVRWNRQGVRRRCHHVQPLSAALCGGRI